MRTLSATGSGNVIIVSRITEVEIMSALARRQREGTYTLATINGYKRLLSRHFQKDYVVIDLNAFITNLAIDLLLRHPLRAYDAAQLATAIVANQRFIAQGASLIFLSADSHLLNAAQAEKLTTDDPNQHP